MLSLLKPIKGSGIWAWLDAARGAMWRLWYVIGLVLCLPLGVAPRPTTTQRIDIDLNDYWSVPNGSGDALFPTLPSISLLPSSRARLTFWNGNWAMWSGIVETDERSGSGEEYELDDLDDINLTFDDDI